MVFTDGSVYNGPVGSGACSAVLYPNPIKPDTGGPYVTSITSSAVGHMVSSNRCETAGLLLGMEIAIHYLTQRFTKSHSGIIYVFSDCINAIDTVTKRAEFNRHPFTSFTSCSCTRPFPSSVITSEFYTARIFVQPLGLVRRQSIKSPSFVFSASPNQT